MCVCVRMFTCTLTSHLIVGQLDWMRTTKKRRARPVECARLAFALPYAGLNIHERVRVSEKVSRTHAPCATELHAFRWWQLYVVFMDIYACVTCHIGNHVFNKLFRLCILFKKFWILGVNKFHRIITKNTYKQWNSSKDGTIWNYLQYRTSDRFGWISNAPNTSWPHLKIPPHDVRTTKMSAIFP